MILCDAQRGFEDSRAPPEQFCARRKGVLVIPEPPQGHYVRGAKGFWRFQGPSRAILCEAQRGFGDSRPPQCHYVRGAKVFWRLQGPFRAILCEAQRGFSDSRGLPKLFCARREGVLVIPGALQSHSVRGAKGFRRFQGCFWRARGLGGLQADCRSDTGGTQVGHRWNTGGTQVGPRLCARRK